MLFRSSRFLIAIAAAALLLIISVSGADAALLPFHFHYSGAEFGNTAEADGVVVLDDVFLNNPGYSSGSGAGDLLDSVTMTVTGASSGNGTFVTGDFFLFYMYTSDALDLNSEWVGQPQPTDGRSNWCEDPFASGDFGFGGNDPAPYSYGGCTLFANYGSGDGMRLTSVTPVPESTTALLLASGLLGLAARGRHSTA